MPKLPSHLTQAQAARYLGWDPKRVYRLTGKGAKLEAELVLGTWMIPTRRVIAAKASEEAGCE